MKPSSTPRSGGTSQPWPDPTDRGPLTQARELVFGVGWREWTKAMLQLLAKQPPPPPAPNEPGWDDTVLTDPEPGFDHLLMGRPGTDGGRDAG